MNPPEDRLLQHFHALPELPAHHRLHARIARTHRKRIRRVVAGGMTAMIAVACLTLVPFLPPDAGPLAPATDSSTSVAAQLDEDALSQVRALDRALQTAYDSGASHDEIASLWIARARLLASTPDHI